MSELSSGKSTEVPPVVVSVTMTDPVMVICIEEHERRMDALRDFIRVIQRREDATVAFYRGREEALKLAMSFYPERIRDVIEDECRKYFKVYKDPYEGDMR